MNDTWSIFKRIQMPTSFFVRRSKIDDKNLERRVDNKMKCQQKA